MTMQNKTFNDFLDYSSRECGHSDFIDLRMNGTFNQIIDVMTEAAQLYADYCVEKAGESEPNTYEIDFGNHLRCQIKVSNNRIEVEGAMNGWGDGVPLSEVKITPLPKTPKP